MAAFVTRAGEELAHIGLRDRCITRDLSWGVPVPAAANKVFYVWFERRSATSRRRRNAAKGDPARRRWQDWWWQADDISYIESSARTTCRSMR